MSLFIIFSTESKRFMCEYDLLLILLQVSWIVSNSIGNHNKVGQQL